ncbi:mechanosensitive ion channel family protein [Nodosilinea sp. PGN35]|uniref:mechanosensitive ion channel family protein n=1 Tax=Nodosilinea sp. PGN35 TaxID=3020489 RepID=UPI0023B28F46|nr:mechanosensitive ion channel family protein [Nodosilinea sp. TSF1-S3]MDF0368262.1 mechanosensitive ion channel family protein [Nodosilinea sp. TSF1-S3]
MGFWAGFWIPRRRRLGRWLLLGLCIALLVAGPPMLAIANSPATDPAAPSPGRPEAVGNKVDGYPVTLDGEPLFYVKQGVDGVTTAEERAGIITQRLGAIAADPTLNPDEIRAQSSDSQSVVLAGDTVLFTVRQEDVAAYGMSHPELAADAVERIQQGVIGYRDRRSLRRIVTSLGMTVLSTVAVFLVLRGILFGSSRLLTYISQRREADTLTLQIQAVRVLGSGATSYLLGGLVRLLRPVLILLALYLYVPFVLSQFPATAAFGDSLLQDIAFRLSLLAQGFVAYLPELAMLGVIALVTYYVIEFARQVIVELGRHDVYPWFYPEWVQPTNRLAMLLIVAIAMVIAGPYLPGFGSPAFQGISLFLGALLTLGSSSAVANALSGIILIYTRAFQLKDFIRINDVVGEVADKSLFVTRVLTPKQETVTIPNASVLNSNVINYSAICRESGGHLLLYTTVTLGYDLPWRRVHEVLIEAARATADIAIAPAPFVLQTALNDFNVSYELNAYTASPAKMPDIYSRLHQNIQDYCNAADIEILSPTFSALRDGNHSTIPADYLPDNYSAPAFVVQSTSAQPPLRNPRLKESRPASQPDATTANGA